MYRYLHKKHVLIICPECGLFFVTFYVHLHSVKTNFLYERLFGINGIVSDKSQ